MFERWREKVGGGLRIPPAPAPPAGDPGSVQVFRASRGFFRYRLLGWTWQQLWTLFSLVAGFLFLRYGSEWLGVFTGELPEELERWNGRGWWFVAELVATVFFFVQLPISFLLISLDYRSRWYVVTDRSLRIREGIWRVREQTMTFSNVQNLSIRQGPIQRLFGIADLEVTSAGGGGAKASEGHGKSRRDLHVGYFRGVSNAAEIRGIIRRSLSGARVAGLGDPDEPVVSVAADRPDLSLPAPIGEPDAATRMTRSGDAVSCARLVLEETRALARVLR